MDLTDHAKRLDAAVEAFVDRVADDRTVLAVIRLGSGRPETLWNTDSLHLWVVVADGSRPRRRSDGEEPRIWRTFVEHDLDLHAELIERAKLKRMVEGNDRNTAGFSWFSERRLVHCTDVSIERWFAEANTPAVRDQRHDQLAIACWVADVVRRTRRRLDVEQQLDAALGDTMELAHALAVLAVVDAGEVVEHRLMRRALQLQPELLAAAWTVPLASRDEASVRAACDAAEAHLDGRFETLMEPILRFVDRFGGPVPLSELCEHFATSSLHPHTLSRACEWMVHLGKLTKLSADLPVTKKSRVRVDEPSYTRT
ncbi:MAG: hypothetical protein KTR31_20535 [Myxococcales bacterium]|nr:hypothetical protein [Myxococcales bacterium]